MKYSIIRSFQIGAVLVLLVAGGQAAAAQAIISTAEKQPYGAYLVDVTGTSLYLFKGDMKGKKSTCYDACVQVWLPLLTRGRPQVGNKADKALLGTIKRENGSVHITYNSEDQADNKADKALLGTIVRKNGLMQVTYDGWPLYYFSKDSGPGSTKGQGVEGFGAEWDLVTPQGKPVHVKEKEQEK